MAKDLVIVESPAKARTVGRFLGKNYDVKASMGHVRDLPRKKLGVDIGDDGFVPTYTVSADKRKIVAELKKAAASAGLVYLATDPDRECEAISWHLIEAANIDIEKTRRVVFHEITKPAIEEAFANTRDIDVDLVDAQQARRVLDRLVGYTLSPVLWSKVKKGTSAGRVQSVALRMVVDRQHQIEAFKPVEYWTIDALLGVKPKENLLKASLVSIEGSKKKPEINNENDAALILKDLKDSGFVVRSYITKESKRRPSAPFITSTLQQEASRRLRFSASRTMVLAQQLYEGIDMGPAGIEGLITYMRTDSTNISAGALTEAKEYINGKYGSDYSLEKPRTFSKKVRGAQEAHEAIRPTSVLRTPEALRDQLDRDQYRLYDLIWKRLVASQMAEALYDRTTVEFDSKSVSSSKVYTFRATGSVLKFDGFRILYTEAKDDETEEEEKGLPILTNGQEMHRDELIKEQHFTEPPPKFTEASLIRNLESEGIGRPSTYASIIGTILERDYVRRDRGRITPTKLGIAVTEFLKEHFEDIVDVGFTAGMEKQLDDIAEGLMQWNPMLQEFYEPFDQAIETAKVEAVRVPREKIDEESDEVCEKCERPMVIRGGRNGRFIACSGFPDCKNTKPLIIGIKCRECNVGELAERKSKRGIFFGCTNYPDCKFAVNTKPISNPCPDCDGILLPSGRDNVRCPSKECGFRGSITEFEEEAETVNAGSVS
ncbi:MAG: DNA topoisomerase-1 [Chloroflexi bacterium]|nr:MAG: DNA topoisomerase-1 [Chloroflexota bacterium]